MQENKSEDVSAYIKQVQESVKGVSHYSHTEVDNETGVVTVYFIQQEPIRRVVITGTLEP